MRRRERRRPLALAARGGRSEPKAHVFAEAESVRDVRGGVREQECGAGGEEGEGEAHGACVVLFWCSAARCAVVWWLNFEKERRKWR